MGWMRGRMVTGCDFLGRFWRSLLVRVKTRQNYIIHWGPIPLPFRLDTLMHPYLWLVLCMKLTSVLVWRDTVVNLPLDPKKINLCLVIVYGASYTNRQRAYGNTVLGSLLVIVSINWMVSWLYWHIVSAKKRDWTRLIVDNNYWTVK